ncbi:MAG: bifunctional DNA-formamidopyrimidine glycosylase/DNA-(apurinic or apyrimidinic site) lyase [Tepidisphaeraceae bacterium]
MPELPEVQRVVDTLRPMLLGRSIGELLHLRDDMVSPGGTNLHALLPSRFVIDVTRRAKRIVITLHDGGRFFIHLGMTGQLKVVEAERERQPHTHLIAPLDDGRELRFVDPRRFGEIRWLSDGDHRDLGPEPLTMRATVFGRQLARTRRAIKTALLDQKLVAGIGNIYADEALFAARIHPLRVASALSAVEVRTLSRAIKRTLSRAIRAGGSTLRDYVDATGAAGSFQKLHRVYDRAGQKCIRCRSTIERIVLGGRSTCFCPSCQRESAG